MEETKTYETDDFASAFLTETLKEVIEALEERGYQAIDQLVGYLMSGDPGYISNHKEARKKIQKLDRSKILELLLRNYIK